MSRILHTLTRVVFVVIVLLVLVGGAFAGVTLYYFGRDLPDYKKLADYVPAIGSKVYASDGTMLADFASEHRVFVPVGEIPKPVKAAFLAAEDRDFYTHKGINPQAVLRAAATDLMRLGRGQRPVGASTITQQVVRHFLLNNSVSVSRKIKEILLAYRIEGELSKDRILEIYLNEIYLGAGAYGVAAAADTYFQKPLDQLSLAQDAFLAALPKAPNNYNPQRNPAGAKTRRDWVLSEMAAAGAITAEQAKAASAEPLAVNVKPTEEQTAQYGYFAEEVRRELLARYGEKTVYEGGLTVRTSYRPDYEAMADRAFHNGLVEYDRRHGWRGPLKHLANAAAAQAALPGIAERPGIATWRLAAVTAVDANGADVVLKDGSKGRIPRTDFNWARRTLSNQQLGPTPRTAADVLTPGDVVYVEPLGAAAPAQNAGYHRAAVARPAAEPQFGLRQIPDVSGGFIVMDPKSGRVIAMVGGWDFTQSQFNRVTQAWRQPGSAIKPLVYATAMDNGFTPDSIVDDSPIELPQGPGLPMWKPENYEGTYAGPSTLRDALIHSRNLVTARLATMVGMPKIAKTVETFDVMDKMPLYYSMALGAGETTLWRLTSAYSMIDNGGHWLLPSVIDTVQDRTGHIVYQKGAGPCDGCYVDMAPTSETANPGFRTAGAPDGGMAKVQGAQFADNMLLYKPTKPDPLISPTADYDIVSMMQGVVQQGTGTAVAAVGKPLAGKTGTTNDYCDAWFVGFSPNLAAGGFVGFDQPRTLGHDETGGHVTAPIFRDFMADALKNTPATPFPVPPGAETAPVVASTHYTQPTYGSTQPQPMYGSTQPQPSYGSTQSDAGGNQYARTGRASSRRDADTQNQDDDPNARAYANYYGADRQFGRNGRDNAQSQDNAQGYGQDNERDSYAYPADQRRSARNRVPPDDRDSYQDQDRDAAVRSYRDRYAPETVRRQTTSAPVFGGRDDDRGQAVTYGPIVAPPERTRPAPGNGPVYWIPGNQ